jgi:hypothetical protein
MASLRVASVVAFAGAVTALVVACKTDYQQGLDDPHYGGPNSLAGQTQPGPSSGDTASTGGTSSIACVKDGKTVADGGACTVSFSKDVLPAFAAASCNQTGSCHGGANPPNQPKIDPADPTGTWNAFAAFKLSNGKLYIDPCSTDATQAALAANVNGKAPPADRGTLMPLGSPTGLDTGVIAKLETWLQCASPDN